MTSLVYDDVIACLEVVVGELGVELGGVISTEDRVKDGVEHGTSCKHEQRRLAPASIIISSISSHHPITGRRQVTSKRRHTAVEQTTTHCPTSLSNHLARLTQSELEHVPIHLQCIGLLTSQSVSTAGFCRCELPNFHKVV